MLDCDWCTELFQQSELFNVEYKNGYANVLCRECSNEALRLFKDDFIQAWR